MGFANYGAFIGILLLLTFVFLLIGLSTREKIKPIGNLFLVITGFLAIITFASHSKHRNLIKSMEKEFFGEFKIDIEKSELESYNKDLYKNLVLRINQNNTFEIFPDNVPFFRDVTGKWNYFDDGDIAFVEIRANGENFQVSANSEMWEFRYPAPKKNMERVRKVIFTRN